MLPVGSLCYYAKVNCHVSLEKKVTNHLKGSAVKDGIIFMLDPYRAITFASQITKKYVTTTSAWQKVGQTQWAASLAQPPLCH